MKHLNNLKLKDNSVKNNFKILTQHWCMPVNVLALYFFKYFFLGNLIFAS